MTSMQTDYWASNVKWREVKKGQLHITSDRLQVLSKKLWQNPKVEWQLEISQMDSLQGNLDRNEIKIGSRVSESVISDTFSFSRSSDARQAFEKLSALWEKLRTQRQEEERARKEAEEKEKRDTESRRQAAFQSYRAFVYSAGARLWETTRNLYKLVFCIRQEDWSAASNYFTAAKDKLNNLVEEAHLPWGPLLDDLGRALEAKQWEASVLGCASSLGRLSESLDSVNPTNEEWEWSEAEKNVAPTWRHLPYLVLFCASYNEALLCHEVCNDESKAENLGRLGNAARIVNQAFSVNLTGYTEELRNALESGNTGAPSEIAARLDEYLVNSFLKLAGQQGTAVKQEGT